LRNSVEPCDPRIASAWVVGARERAARVATLGAKLSDDRFRGATLRIPFRQYQ
jgi:hypothetical protein